MKVRYACQVDSRSLPSQEAPGQNGECFGLSKRLVNDATEPVLMGTPDTPARGNGTLICNGVDSEVGAGPRNFRKG